MRPSRFRAGAGWLAVLACALVAGGCSLPGRTTGPLELKAVFDDVGDLVVNHSVQMADVRVGSVSKIELTDDFRAMVTMSVKDVDIPRDIQAVLRTTSLLGEKFIELRPNGDPTEGPFLQDGDMIEQVGAAPELEFVAEQAVQLLGGIAADDVATLIETGAIGFGGRGTELHELIEELATFTNTLASQADDIVGIIDGLDRATGTLAAGAPDVDELLVNLAETSTVLAENRDQAVATLSALTELARSQNEVIFEPYLEDAGRQIRQLDAILAEIANGRDHLGSLLDWFDRFAITTPQNIPGDFTLIFLWAATCPGPNC